MILDGATGTELERAGLPTGLPLWSTHALLEAPETVRAIHAAQLEAGAELITANTFRTQRRTLARAGLDQQDETLTRLAVELAREATIAHAERAPATEDASGPSSLFVAGSLPPLEDCYRPDLVPEALALAREHGRQAELLAEAGVDLILIETMNTQREAAAAAAAAVRTGRPFAVSFVANGPNRLLSGEPLLEAAGSALAVGAVAVGLNCVPPSVLIANAPTLRKIEGPLLLAPNLGEPDEAMGFRRREDVTPAAFARLLAGWRDEPRLRIVGGCCGTTPAHIAALANAFA
jgi:S-methylmethionine-dependent homocysteine/selenocysteine methylase